MLGMTLHSMVFWILAPVTSYLNWLWRQDFSPVFQEYACLLAACQRRVMGQRLVLKAPDHMPHLDLLLRAVPGARILQLHRDPVTCVTSLSSLFYSTHIALSETVQPRDLAETNGKMMAYFLQANRQARQDPDVNQQVLDIRFEDLIADPMQVIRGIYAYFDLDFSDAYVARLAAALQAQAARSKRSHEYAAGQFGLSELEMRSFFHDKG
jgi:hypothetical protein